MSTETSAARPWTEKSIEGRPLQLTIHVTASTRKVRPKHMDNARSGTRARAAGLDTKKAYAIMIWSTQSAPCNTHTKTGHMQDSNNFRDKSGDARRKRHLHHGGPPNNGLRGSRCVLLAAVPRPDIFRYLILTFGPKLSGTSF